MKDGRLIQTACGNLRIKEKKIEGYRTLSFDLLDLDKLLNYPQTPYVKMQSNIHAGMFKNRLLTSDKKNESVQRSQETQSL